MLIEIDPRVDVVFKNLFGSTEHPRLTMSLVNSLLAMAGLPKAVQLTIQNPFQLADFPGAFRTYPCATRVLAMLDVFRHKNGS
jgi:hypothetical protein